MHVCHSRETQGFSNYSQPNTNQAQAGQRSLCSCCQGEKRKNCDESEMHIHVSAVAVQVVSSGAGSVSAEVVAELQCSGTPVALTSSKGGGFIAAAMHGRERAGGSLCVWEVNVLP